MSWKQANNGKVEGNPHGDDNNRKGNSVTI